MFKLSNSSHADFSESEDIKDAEHGTPVIHDNRPKAGAAVIGPSISVRGDVSGDEDLIIQGRLEGTVSFPKNNVTVGGEGHVKANLEALKITVEGQVIGDLRGSERVTVKPSGHVEGNIAAPRVVLEDGCHFKGSVEMNVDESGRISQGKDQTARARKATAEAAIEKPDAVTPVSGVS